MKLSCGVPFEEILDRKRAGQRGRQYWIMYRERLNWILRCDDGIIISVFWMKLTYEALARMGEIELQGQSGWAGWDRWSGQDEDYTEVPMVPGTRYGASPMNFEARKVAVISSYHHFHQCYRGRGLFVSFQKNNNNALHTNMNCKIAQYSTNIT